MCFKNNNNIIALFENLKNVASKIVTRLESSQDLAFGKFNYSGFSSFDKWKSLRLPRKSKFKWSQPDVHARNILIRIVRVFIKESENIDDAYWFTFDKNIRHSLVLVVVVGVVVVDVVVDVVVVVTWRKLSHVSQHALRFSESSHSSGMISAHHVYLLPYKQSTENKNNKHVLLWSLGTVMFSQACVFQWWVGYPGYWRGHMLEYPSSLGHRTWMPTPTATDILWLPLNTWSNLFTWGPAPSVLTPSSSHQNMHGGKWAVRILLECCLHLIFVRNFVFIQIFPKLPVT